MRSKEIIVGGVTYSPPDIQKALGSAGYRLGQDKFSATFLGELKLNIKTLVDVGVHNGTPELYAAFPDKKIVLVEPLPGFEAKLKGKFGTQYDFDFVNCAAGSEPATLKLSVSGAGSTLLAKYAGSENDARYEGQIDVPVRTLDDVLSAYTGPFGIKIDTEGFELEALKGAERTLSSTEFVIAEVSVRPRFEGSYSFADIVTWLNNRGLVFLATLNDKYGINTFYDCLFVRASHPLMAVKDRRMSGG